MKRIYQFIAVAACVFTFAQSADAQTPVEDELNLVNTYIEDAYATRSEAWWNALESQLTLTLDKPVDQVTETAIQNVIFFAKVHGDKIDLDESVPYLMDVYREHPNESVRVMAVAALHAIGSDRAMRTMYRDLKKESSPRVKHTMLAAIADFYGENAYMLGAREDRF